MGKQTRLNKPHRMTEAALAANRANAAKGGRPQGAMNADKLAFRDRFRAREVELADNLINLARMGKPSRSGSPRPSAVSTGVGVGLPSRTTATGKVAQ